MEAVNRDLKAAGIEKKDERGKIVDFHSHSGHSFAQRLKEAGIPFAVAMRMMRQADPKLLASVYGDQDAYGLTEYAAKLPALWSKKSGCHRIRHTHLGISCHSVSKPVATEGSGIASTSRCENELISRLLSCLGVGGTAPALGIEPRT